MENSGRLSGQAAINPAFNAEGSHVGAVCKGEVRGKVRTKGTYVTAGRKGRSWMAVLGRIEGERGRSGGCLTGFRGRCGCDEESEEWVGV